MAINSGLLRARRASDLAYWSEKLRKANYDFDEEELRPYFSIENVIEGMFRLTEQIFGFKIVEGKSIFVPLGETTEHIGVEVWHPEVKFYELHDAKSGEHLGSFYADWHPREEKRGGAWMNYLRTGSPVIGNQAREPHLGLICGNLTRSEPRDDRPPNCPTHRSAPGRARNQPNAPAANESPPCSLQSAPEKPRDRSGDS